MHIIRHHGLAYSNNENPLAPPFSKGEIAPPFGKGRLGGIL